MFADNCTNIQSSLCSLYMFIISIIIFIVIGFNIISKYSKKTRSNKHCTQLNIIANKSLGGRQFLTIVEYQQTQILLGISPGNIQCLHIKKIDCEENANKYIPYAQIELNNGCKNKVKKDVI